VITFQQLIEAGGEILCSKIHKLNNSIWNMEELPDRWKESNTVLLKKSDKTDSSNYWGITLLSTSYKILSNILPSNLSPHIDKSIGVHQCEFQHNRSTTDQIFCIRQILEKRNESTLRQYISYS
jgi:hypothetical protein